MLPAAKPLRPLAGIFVWLLLASAALAQGPWHYLNKADMPPGVIGLRQLQRGGPLPGYFQPVEVSAPDGTLLSISTAGGFSEAKRDKLLAGMLIGHVYRLKVSNIPLHEGHELFPTIEVIDRLHPPPGQAARFPIPIVLTQEELQFALDGRYVLRVIYLENPRNPLLIREIPGEQPFFEIAPGQDAMQTADRLGRPMAILRMGSRVPLPEEDQSHFLYQHPPVQLLDVPALVPRRDGLEEPLPAPMRMGRPSGTFPREALTR
jgi:hypothetical protein